MQLAMLYNSIIWRMCALFQVQDMAAQRKPCKAISRAARHPSRRPVTATTHSPYCRGLRREAGVGVGNVTRATAD